MYVGVNVYIRIFLISALAGQLHSPAALTPGKELPIRIGYEVGWTPRRGEKSSPYRDSNSDPSAIQPVASRYINYTIPAPYIYTVLESSFISSWNKTELRT
jgi:hypothetical protein